jgi:glycosyltransferase involved in cell wall biosynthesis
VLNSCVPQQWSLFPSDKKNLNSRPGRIAEGLRVARGLRKALSKTSDCFAHICCGSDSSGWGLREGILHARLSRNAGLPTLLHLHASALPELLTRKGTESALFKSELARIDALAVPTHSSATLLESIGVPSQRVAVIPNFVPVPPWNPSATNSQKPLRLLMIGSIEERKGFEVLLEALESLPSETPSLQIDAYGPCKVSTSVLARWKERGERHGLQFLGEVSPTMVGEQLRSSDGLLLPSLAECQPFVLLEAMASSRPVIATRVGGIAHLLRDGAGDCLEPGNPEELAQALVRWIEDPIRRDHLARSGWERVHNEHNMMTGVRATQRAWDIATNGQAGRMLDPFLQDHHTAGTPQT